MLILQSHGCWIGQAISLKLLIRRSFGYLLSPSLPIDFPQECFPWPSSLSLLLLPCLLSKRLIAFHISHYDSQGQDKKRAGHKEQGPTSLQSALFKSEQDTLSVPRSMTWQMKERLCPVQLATCETMHGSLSKKVEESIWAYYPCSHISLKMAFPDLCFFRLYSFFFLRSRCY